MAANMKAVKLRIKSVQSTMQITKAMELVASSKLRKAKERAEVCRPYFRTLHSTLKDIAVNNTDFSSVYAAEARSEKFCYVVIAGDRGLAGGYNANLFKRMEEDSAGRDYMVLPVGKKAVEYFNRRKIEIVTEDRRYFCRGLFSNRKYSLQKIPGGRIWSHRALLYQLCVHAFTAAGCVFCASSDRS